ncbi:SusC/RagA family TonB-linked outer membrane protein [Coprobacter tertius]
MKHKMLFVLLLSSMVYTPVSAQKVTINLQQVKLEKVFSAVTKQTGLTVAYSRPTVNPDMIVSVRADNEELSGVLSRLFAGTNVTFEIGKKIYLKEKTADVTKFINQIHQIISGKITDNKGEPIIGASILVKGTTKGTISDLNGNFTIDAAPDQTLIVSYIGYKSQELPVLDKKSFKIKLLDDTEVLDEVVVTALGIKRSEKALSYNVQQVNADAVTNNKDANFINSLSGKVAGVNINASSSGAGGMSKVVMRGTKSIMQSSNALYVIDGVPMFSNTSKVNGTEFTSQGNSEPIADINPEDIESMSVLTGAAAAALYGSDAANGAIIITTKKGKKGKISITVNSNVEFNSPFVLPRFQSRYGSGIGGVLDNGSSRSWGPKMTIANYQGYNPKDDYFQTGVIGTENISFSTGNDKNQTYASAAAVNSKGIIPNNKYDRYNFTVRNTTSFLKDKMTLDMTGSYILQEDRNMVNQGTYNNPLVGAYLFPRGNDWNDIKIYEEYDNARKIYTQKWPTGDGNMTMQNPYWVNYRNLRENRKDRYILGASLDYQVLDWLKLSGRVRLDNASNDYTEKAYASTNTQLTELSDRGLYGVSRSYEKQLYADFLISINKNFDKNWSLQTNFGGSFTDMRYDMMSVRGPIADGSKTFAGEKPGLTNGFYIQNLSTTKTKNLQSGWREQTQSLYASAEVGYKSTYYLNLTGRNDWPSQLAGPNSANTSFFYPSVGGSIILSELISNLNKDYLSYWKVRGSFASVGTAFERYIANPIFKWNSSAGQYSNLTDYPVYNLKPERTNSFEVGMNIRFFKNFELDVTYYNAKTMNQTFNPQLPVGEYARIYIQTGAVRNQGVELALNFNKTWNDFIWNTGVIYSMNKNKILALADNVINPVTGEKFSISSLNMGGLGSTRFILKEGGSMGDIYSLIDLKRDANGAIYIDEKNNVATQNLNPNNYIKLGSVLPKGNLAWNNSFSWKNINISFLLTARLGGVVFSRTQALLDNFGVSETSAAARDQGYVSINEGDRVNPENWYSVVAGGTAVPQYYSYSATNIRLQEASIGYTIPKKWLGNVCDIKVSLVGRNLWMIYNKAPFDPESVASTDNFYQGIDYFMIPSLRNVGFNLSFKF